MGWGVSRGSTTSTALETGGAGLVTRALLNPLSMRLALVALAATFVLPPDGAGIPLCWFDALYGLPCPGCGMTRSLTSIAHLHFDRALAYHPFGIVVYPLLIALGIANLVGDARRARVGAWLAHRSAWATRIYLGLVFAFLTFGVLRTGATALGWITFEG